MHTLGIVLYQCSVLKLTETKQTFVGFQGLIFETEVEPEEKFFQGGLEKFWKQVSQTNIKWFLDKEKLIYVL